MVSQSDVARAAGVSPATASLALNNHPRVSPRTRLRVQKAARRLGYVPNHAARQLIRSRFGMPAGADVRQVGLVSCCGNASPLQSTYMAFLHGVEQAIAARDGILIFLRQTGESFARRLEMLNRSGTVEAWILFGAVTCESLAPIEAFQRPWVVLGDHACARSLHHVNMDFRLMGRLAVRHLLDLGHRDIGFLGSRLCYRYREEVLAGFREGMQAAGLPVNPAWVVLREEHDDPGPHAPEAMDRCWSLSPRPTAFVYGEAGESELVLSWCARRGVRLPHDMSLVFCELDDGPAFAPGVARVAASAAEAGRTAVSLLEEVAGRRDLPPRQVLVAPRLVPGWSAGVHRAGERDGHDVRPA